MLFLAWFSFMKIQFHSGNADVKGASFCDGQLLKKFDKIIEIIESDHQSTTASIAQTKKKNLK